MDQYEVTNEQYKTFCDATGHAYPPTSGSEYSYVPENYVTDYPNYPAACVTWYDAVQFCNWRSREDGLETCYNETMLEDYFLGNGIPTEEMWHCDFGANGYRLPTEAEWEYGARGGLEGKRYPWGNEDPAGRGNYGAYNNTGVYRSDMVDFGFQYNRGPTPVGRYDANGYGLYDMAGNLWEWCNDFYDPEYYSKSPKSNPKGPPAGETTMLRGGSWFFFPEHTTCANRFPHLSPMKTYHSVGFRCVRSP